LAGFLLSELAGAMVSEETLKGRCLLTHYLRGM
jgi:hypothetical protein